MNFNAFLPLKGLTTIASVCFICKSETHSDSQSPRPTRRQAALHHRNPARLLAPSPHPPSLRLRRLRPRTRPLGLGLNRQLSRRTHQAAQPLRPTETHGPTVLAQLPQTQGHLGTHLPVEPATPAPGEESMTRIAEPQLSFADLELRNQGVHLDPLLQGIVGFLDDHAPLVEQVRQDLARGLKNPNTGRSGITPSQALRSLILMRVKNWDYRELRERINDGYTLRGFTDFDSHRVPQPDAFTHAFNRLTPANHASHQPSRGPGCRPTRPGRRQAVARGHHSGGNRHPFPYRCYLIVLAAAGDGAILAGQRGPRRQC